MTPDRYEQICALFHAVCELDPVQRKAKLDERCANDPELRHEVEELLREEDDVDPLLVESHIGAVMDISQAVASATDGLPRNIGKYRLIRSAIKRGVGGLETYERMLAHLKANEVDLGATPLTLGADLTMNPKKERFTNNALANEFLSRNYRKPFVVPENV
jgi:hypothetical protein